MTHQKETASDCRTYAPVHENLVKIRKTLIQGVKAP
jgi:hypothetical protein